MEKIRTVLADDQVLFVESIRFVLEARADDIYVVGIAHDGREALDLVERYHPDVVLMDVRMPVLDGVEATRVIRRRFPSTQVIILTTFDDDAYVHEALKYGAIGYLLKDMPPDKLISSIRAAVNTGSILVAPHVAARLVHQPGDSGRESPTEEDPLVSQIRNLGKREKQILKALADGWNNREIADRLYISEQTAKNYVSLIYSKLGIHDRIKIAHLIHQIDTDSIYW